MIITFCCAAVLCATAQADTIVLKNGDRIFAESVKEYNGRVEYWVGTNSMTIPKSIVARIESGGSPTVPVEPVTSGANVEVPRVDMVFAGGDEPWRCRAPPGPRPRPRPRSIRPRAGP